MSNSEQVKLLTGWSSPYALRAVWALKLKGVEYETIVEDPAKKSPLLLRHNPVHKKVPVLIHGDRAVAESLVILEYVDETWTGYAFLPDHPYQRAAARFLAKFGDDQVFPSVWNAFVKEGTEQEAALAQSRSHLKFLEEHLKGRRFFGGDKIGFTDLALGWMANIISIFEEISQVEMLDPETFPSLAAWIQNFKEVPLIGESWPPRDRMVAKFKALREQYIAPK
uniref:glutathione transferase n=1 Tax=Kalanchoe fedtschenkoi TaxID=63787 RepID=A0A7N0T0I6_KALFE